MITCKAGEWRESNGGSIINNEAMTPVGGDSDASGVIRGSYNVWRRMGSVGCERSQLYPQNRL